MTTPVTLTPRAYQELKRTIRQEARQELSNRRSLSRVGVRRHEAVWMPSSDLHAYYVSSSLDTLSTADDAYEDVVWTSQTSTWAFDSDTSNSRWSYSSATITDDRGGPHYMVGLNVQTYITPRDDQQAVVTVEFREANSGGAYSTNSNTIIHSASRANTTTQHSWGQKGTAVFVRSSTTADVARTHLVRIKRNWLTGGSSGGTAPITQYLITMTLWYP